MINRQPYEMDSITLVALPIVLFILSLGAGILWFTPEYRANYWLWQGNDRKAGKLLESLIEQSPEKLHLYRKLARIYYLENRRDRRALKVFELILRFKIPFEWRDELYTLVAKHYIIEGRKDNEAIRLIERAVDKELKRMSSFAL